MQAPICPSPMKPMFMTFSFLMRGGERMIATISQEPDNLPRNNLLTGHWIRECVTTRYPLSQANQALADLRAGRFEGAAVLVP